MLLREKIVSLKEQKKWKGERERERERERVRDGGKARVGWMSEQAYFLKVNGIVPRRTDEGTRNWRHTSTQTHTHTLVFYAHWIRLCFILVAVKWISGLLLDKTTVWLVKRHISFWVYFSPYRRLSLPCSPYWPHGSSQWCCQRWTCTWERG